MGTLVNWGGNGTNWKMKGKSRESVRENCSVITVTDDGQKGRLRRG